MVQPTAKKGAHESLSRVANSFAIDAAPAFETNWEPQLSPHETSGAVMQSESALHALFDALTIAT
jgi:hypothetical protein